MAGDPQRWLILTTRYGKEIENPSPEDLSHAMEELRQENPEGTTAADGAEQANAWLECGSDGGPKYILSVNHDGATSLAEFMNQDADDPTEELTRKIPHEKALALWVLLAEGSPEKVEAELADNNPLDSK